MATDRRCAMAFATLTASLITNMRWVLKFFSFMRCIFTSCVSFFVGFLYVSWMISFRTFSSKIIFFGYSSDSLMNSVSSLIFN